MLLQTVRTRANSLLASHSASVRSFAFATSAPAWALPFTSRCVPGLLVRVTSRNCRQCWTTPRETPQQ
jgi:hypothetical protein